jgi:hypothetical protein
VRTRSRSLGDGGTTRGVSKRPSSGGEQATGGCGPRVSGEGGSRGIVRQ